MDTDAISETASGIGFIGGVLFEIGAYLMVVEALDRYVLLEDIGMSCRLDAAPVSRLTRSGREHEFGTALGNFLSPSFRERIEYDFSSKRKRRIMSGSKTTGDPQRHEYPNGSKGWIWWGRPQWHDMGYFAVSIATGIGQWPMSERWRASADHTGIRDVCICDRVRVCHDVSQARVEWERWKHVEAWSARAALPLPERHPL